MESKICTKCKTQKLFSEFYKKKNGKFGLRATCKGCELEYRLAHREEMRAYSKEHHLRTRDIKLKRYIDNREEIAKKAKEYSLKNKDKISERMKDYYQINKKFISEKKHQYYLSNQNAIKDKTIKRDLLKKHRIPNWANLNKVNEMYKLARKLTKQTGIQYHVDHIIPLQGETVSGLHVENNLRIITAFENISKKNKLIEDLL